jgi:amidase
VWLAQLGSGGVAEANEARAAIDVVLMPVSARIAPRTDAWDGLGAIRAFGRQARLIAFTPPWNLVGWPALALPTGHDPNGVPIGVQFLAAPDREPALIALWWSAVVWAALRRP